jgi:hypothetical protein
MNNQVAFAKKTFNLILKAEPSSALEDGDENYFSRARESAGCVWKAAG